MRPAATVLLLREENGELEVLMMRRGVGLAFMAGMWVFPGGRVDEADASASSTRPPGNTHIPAMKASPAPRRHHQYLEFAVLLAQQEDRRGRAVIR